MGSSDAIARNSGVPANTTEELIQYAKENPGALEYGSSSAFGHLVTESFAHATGVDFLHVPYKGGGPATLALLSGEVKLQMTVLNSAMSQFVKEGKLKVLGSTAPEESSLAPGVKPISHTVPDFKAELWQGILAPAHTPTPVIERLNLAFTEALSTPALLD